MHSSTKDQTRDDGGMEMQPSPIDDMAINEVDEDLKQDEKPKTSKLKAIIWDTWDKSPEERKTVNKIDWFIMTYVCIAYFVKYLYSLNQPSVSKDEANTRYRDQVNVQNAYVSGMQEDLAMGGQDYNLMQTLFTSGYVVGNLASQLVLLKVRPSIWLPSLELIWSILVMGMAGAQNTNTILVLRFFIGLLEASAFPGILTLLGNWYTPAELGKRSVIFISTSSAGSMFSGYLQAGLYSGMDGVQGLAAWRWLFIFDGIIGIPVAIYGFFAVPDAPHNSRAKWLKPHQRQMAIERMDRVGRRPPAKLSLQTFKDVLSHWPIYLFPIAFACHVLAIRIYSYFLVYLEDTGRWSVEAVNSIPSGGFAFQIVIGLVYAWVSDYYKTRVPVICAACGVAMIGTIILSVYPEHNLAAMMAGWILTYGETGAGALIMTQVNEVCSFSSEHRVITIGWTEAFSYAMSAWVILFAYPSGQAPHFDYGFELATMFWAIEILAILAIGYCAKKYPMKLRD
ncbi:uncharacterized protein LTR77_007697 [Saxophila tyrrhenica]|uniref:Major facilitator superfamily (MFS) profile domain-containing protein n=1 Tax=Saxophila tyrrhenica TaxID=1690608 RepID=A0AAV9P3G4_9PEZI|nr:hypothetical protein LTR77_007697 [Saxophila tyrrhenica]